MTLVWGDVTTAVPVRAAPPQWCGPTGIRSWGEPGSPLLSGQGPRLRPRAFFTPRAPATTASSRRERRVSGVGHSPRQPVRAESDLGEARRTGSEPAAVASLLTSAVMGGPGSPLLSGHGPRLRPRAFSVRAPGPCGFNGQGLARAGGRAAARTGGLVRAGGPRPAARTAGPRAYIATWACAAHGGTPPVRATAPATHTAGPQPCTRAALCSAHSGTSPVHAGNALHHAPLGLARTTRPRLPARTAGLGRTRGQRLTARTAGPRPCRRAAPYGAHGGTSAVHAGSAPHRASSAPHHAGHALRRGRYPSPRGRHPETTRGWPRRSETTHEVRDRAPSRGRSRRTGCAADRACGSRACPGREAAATASGCRRCCPPPSSRNRRRSAPRSPSACR